MKTLLRKMFFCFGLILITSTIYGQDYLKITYDASQGLGGEIDMYVEGGMAMGNPEKIYMHSGAGPWVYFPEDQMWGCDNGVGEMTKVEGSDVLWEIVISKEFYGIEEWMDIGLLFRSGGPCGYPENPDDCGDNFCLEGKSDLGSDIYIRLIGGLIPEVQNQDGDIFTGVTIDVFDPTNDSIKLVRAQPFYDENENDILDEQESILFNLPLEITPVAESAFQSNTNGGMLFYVSPSTYTIQYNNTENSLWQTNTSYTIDITDATETDTTLYFPMQPVTDFLLQNVDLSSSITRCNQETNVWLTYTNNSSESTSGYINLLANDLATFVSATPPVDSIAGDTLYWFYEDLYPTYSEQIKIIYQMPGVDNIGENLVFDAEIETWEGNGNNKYVYTSELVCAYDPNDKLVTPIGVGEENYTLFEDSLFKYTIRFQNTGNDTAFNIIIKDTINENLAIETYQFIASSHEVNTKINEDTRIIEFEFKDIYLPDSNINELASHGFVKFNIESNDNLAENTPIENTAGIYFDLNPPIITNTTNNTMVSMLPTSIATVNATIPFTLYPNPNTGNFTIQTKESPIKTLRIYNSLGTVIQEKNINNFQTTIDLDVVGGIYFISIETEKGTVIEKVIIQ